MTEDIAELGLEGLNHVAERYHDFIYDHLPAFPQYHRHRHRQPQPQPPDPSPPDPARSRERPSRDDYYDNHPLAATMDVDRDYDPRQPPSSRHRRRDASPPRDGPSWERSYYGRPMSEAGSRHDEQRRFSAGPMPRQSNPDYAYPPPPPPAVAGYLPPPPGQDVPRYIPPYDPAPRDKSRQRARSLNSRSSSPERKRKHKWDKRSETATFASTVVGALAGGFAGNELGKGDTFTTIASAVIGAVGGAQLEKQYEKKHHKKDSSRRERDLERRRSRDRRDDRRDVRRVEVEEKYGYLPNSYDRDWRGRDGWEVEHRRRRSR